jgi:hypothetical protein
MLRTALSHATFVGTRMFPDQMRIALVVFRSSGPSLLSRFPSGLFNT